MTTVVPASGTVGACFAASIRKDWHREKSLCTGQYTRKSLCTEQQDRARSLFSRGRSLQMRKTNRKVVG